LTREGGITEEGEKGAWMAIDDEIREAVRAALAVAAFAVNPILEDHIRFLARHCEDLLAAVAVERERCAKVMAGVFRGGGFPGFGPLADAIRKDAPG
jgi:hypothetical protein